MPRKPRDKYDEAITLIMSGKTTAVAAWGVDHTSPRDAPHVRAHCLFQYATPTGRPHPSDPSCACLTQIREDPSFFRAYTPELTAEIAADKLIPADPEHIDTLSLGHRRRVLKRFAEWQRHLDKEIRS